MAILLLAAGVYPGCQCGPNGLVDPQPFVARADDDVLNCNCNLQFRHPDCPDGVCRAHLPLRLCVPPEVRAAAPAEADAGVGEDGGLGADPYAQAVDRYCRETITPTVYHLIKVLNGDWCSYKEAFAPDGGVGDSVVCFAQPIEDRGGLATARDDGSCEQACAPVSCSFESNCGPEVQDDFGNIHLENCRCSQVTIHGCPGDPPGQLPTPVFCRPPADVLLR